MDALSAGAMRNIVIWIAWAVGAALLLGAVPPLMRVGARRSDPSVAAALFAVVFTAGACGVAAFTGTLSALWDIDNATLVKLLLCGLVSAFTWLCLFTALTGGQAGRVVPVVNLSTPLVLVASYFLLDAPLGLWRLCCIVLILLGTVLIESRSLGKPRGRLWMLYAALAALSCAGLALIERLLLPGLDSALIDVARGASAAVLLVIFVLARGRQRTVPHMPAGAFFCIPLAALACCGSEVCAYLASLRGDMSMLAPVTIVSFGMAMLLSRVALKERQPGAAVFGTLLVLLGMFAIQMGW